MGTQSNQPATARGFAPTTPHIALALGGGSARGMAHILMLEAFDELGIVPCKIVGTSIGSLMGACYAAGMTAADIRAFCEDLLASKMSFLGRFGRDFPSGLRALWSFKSVPLIDGVTFFEFIFPDQVKCNFDDLKIPFAAVTTDFYAIDQVIIDKGPVIPAITASSALPTLMAAVKIDDKVLIDGGFVNPTPIDLVIGEGDISVAIDVTGTTQRQRGKEFPGSVAAWVGATQILFHTITREKLKSGRPDIFIQPAVGGFGTLNFFQLREIFKASEPAKDDLKRQLEKAIESHERQGR